jgi:hypothetical protein
VYRPEKYPFAGGLLAMKEKASAGA